MSLIAITDPNEISACYARLSEAVTKGGEPLPRHVGWQGGGGDYIVYWHPKEGIWSLREALENNFWFGFGTNDPTVVTGLAPVFQIGLPRRGVNRRYAGVFVRETDSDAISVAHSGKIGGGKPGVGKAAFLDFSGVQAQATVTWPDRQKSSYLILAALEDRDLLTRLATFAHRVEKFRNSLAKVPKQ